MEVSKPKRVNIQDLREDLRPREKLMDKGVKHLSNLELLAVLINSGNKKASALDLANQLLEFSQQNLNTLHRLTFNEINEINGIGPVKSSILAAAFELGRRRKEEGAAKDLFIRNSRDAYLEFEHHLEDLETEEFWILLLNRKNKVLSKRKISEGGISSTIVDPKIIFNIALNRLASSIILCHNHPSGLVEPSVSDKRLTHKISEGGKLLEIQVVDHIIIGKNNYFSFADNGLI